MAKVILRELDHEMRPSIEMSRVPSVGDLIQWERAWPSPSEAFIVIGVVHFPSEAGKLDAEVHVEQFGRDDTLPWYR